MAHPPPEPSPSGPSALALNLRVWRLAVPIVVTNVSLPLLHVVDTAVVGQLPGAHHLGAVAVGSLIFNVIVFGLSFVRMGTAGLAARALGAGDSLEVRATLGLPIPISLAMGPRKAVALWDSAR